VENYPLYEWTKATIKAPAKKEKYLKSFTLYVGEREVYAKDIADALEADLQPLAISGLITRISKYDTNPANNPQPPQRASERASHPRVCALPDRGSPQAHMTTRFGPGI
jgi:hypothetical protein